MRWHAHVDFQLFSQKSSGIPELWCPFSCKLNSTKCFNPTCKDTLILVALWECLSLLVRKLLIHMKGSRMLWILPIGVVWATWTAKRYQFSDYSQLWLLMGWGFQVFHSHSQSAGAYRQPLQIFITYLRKAFSGWFCFTSSVFSQGLFCWVCHVLWKYWLTLNVLYHTTQTVAPNRKTHAESITLIWDILKEVRASFSCYIC